MTTIHRIQNLQARLKTLGCEVYLVEDPINLEYLTGAKVSSGKLLVYHDHATFLVDGRYFEDCKKKCSCEVELYRADKKLTEYFRKGTKSLGFSTSHTSYKAYLDLQKLFSAQSIDLVPVEDPVKYLRAIKSNEEVLLLKEAAELGSKGYDFVLHNLKEGVSEEELAVALELFWKNHGGKKLAFEPIIAFGANSSKPHYRAGATKLKKNDIVLIDIGVIKNNYHSDMTRTVFFGTPLPKLEEIYELVREAQSRALKLCKPGTTIGDLDDAARKFIDSKGYGEAFSHGLGHGVGLEIHEYPLIRNSPGISSIKLEPGMAITIEPGIYLPDIGGVRIEDLVVITENGHMNLTDRPKELIRC